MASLGCSGLSWNSLQILWDIMGWKLNILVVIWAEVWDQESTAFQQKRERVETRSSGGKSVAVRSCFPLRSDPAESWVSVCDRTAGSAVVRAQRVASVRREARAPIVGCGLCSPPRESIAPHLTDVGMCCVLSARHVVQCCVLVLYPLV